MGPLNKETIYQIQRYSAVIYVTTSEDLLTKAHTRHRFVLLLLLLSNFWYASYFYLNFLIHLFRVFWYLFFTFLHLIRLFLISNNQYSLSLIKVLKVFFMGRSGVSCLHFNLFPSNSWFREIWKAKNQKINFSVIIYSNLINVLFWCNKNYKFSLPFLSRIWIFSKYQFFLTIHKQISWKTAFTKLWQKRSGFIWWNMREKLSPTENP